MSDTEKTASLVRQIARESVALIDHNVATAKESTLPTLLRPGAALARLALLRDTQLRAGESEYELFTLRDLLSAQQEARVARTRH